MTITFLDCTLRDGGYYNNWDFERTTITEYLAAMAATAVDYVELGFRSLRFGGFRGACAYTTDAFVRSLGVPESLRVGVMVNAAELVSHPDGPARAVDALFASAGESPVVLVRLACHLSELEATMPACSRLKDLGYEVAVNVMQIADRSEQDVEQVGSVAARSPIDVLYFADSLGSMDAEQTARIVHALRRTWKHPIGIHTHDNMGRAVANTLRAVAEGVTWLDSTVTGMGRGPGNAPTEYLAIELQRLGRSPADLTPLLTLIRRHFAPLRAYYGWGTNPYYYLAGWHGIHPTFVQEMMGDSRYEEAEMLSVIEYLRTVGGKRFNTAVLDAGRQMYGGEPSGTWAPASLMQGRDVLIVGPGPGAKAHREALEDYVRSHRPFVLALNTDTTIRSDLIDARAACHPFRVMTDHQAYAQLPQPLIVPVGRLPEAVRAAIPVEKRYDFGLAVQPGGFDFFETAARTPSSLVIAYSLACATSGKAARVLLAGFDGYGADDPRTAEMDDLLAAYQAAPDALPVVAVTPTRYRIPSVSIYALQGSGR